MYIHNYTSPNMKWHVTPHAIHVNIYTRDGVTSIMLLKRMVCTVWIRWMVRCWSILFILLIIFLLGGYEWMWESMQSILLGKDKLFLWEEEVLIRYLVWVVITHQLLSAKHFGPSLSNTHGIVVLHGFTTSTTSIQHRALHDGQTAFFPFCFSHLHFRFASLLHSGRCQARCVGMVFLWPCSMKRLRTRGGLC